MSTAEEMGLLQRLQAMPAQLGTSMDKLAAQITIGRNGVEAQH